MDDAENAYRLKIQLKRSRMELKRMTIRYNQEKAAHQSYRAEHPAPPKESK